MSIINTMTKMTIFHILKKFNVVNGLIISFIHDFNYVGRNLKKKYEILSLKRQGQRN